MVMFENIQNFMTKKKRSSIDTVIINSVELLTTQSRDLHYILTRCTYVIKNVHIVFKLIQLNKIVKEPVFFGNISGVYMVRCVSDLITSSVSLCFS